MDYLMGIKGPNFVMVCSDTSAAHSIIKIKHDEDKIVPIDSHKLFGISGEAGDRVNFTEFIIANVKLYAMRNNTELTTKAVAHYTRGQLATALRQSPYHANLLLAGYDKQTGPSLYWMDYLATLNKINTGGTGYAPCAPMGAPVGAQGAMIDYNRNVKDMEQLPVPEMPEGQVYSKPKIIYSFNDGFAGSECSMFVLSLFDKLWRPDLTEAEALDMMMQGIEEVKQRVVVAPTHYVIKVVDANGIRTVKTVAT